MAWYRQTVTGRILKPAGSARGMGAVRTMPFQAPVGADRGTDRPRGEIPVRGRTRQFHDCRGGGGGSYRCAEPARLAYVACRFRSTRR